MEPCRFDMGCSRPLCPYGHSGRRAARWAALWSNLAMEEDEARATDNGRLLEAVEKTPKDHISEGILEQFVEAFDEPVPPLSGGKC